MTHKTDVFLKPHDYELFQLSQEIDTIDDNLNRQDSHVCENSYQDGPIFTHATNPCLTFALPIS